MSGEPSAEVIRAALIDAGEPDPGALEARPLPGGSSRDLWLLTAQRAAGQAWVLRRDPADELAQTSRAAEFAVQRAVYEAGVPVPRPIVFGDFGTPGMIMEYVLGEVIPRRVLRSPPAGLARQVGAALATLRGVDTTPFVELSRGPLDACSAAIDTVRDNLDAAGDALPALELGLRWLTLNKPAPAAPTIVHGDLRLGNLMVTEHGLRSIIDWEFWHLGDPVEDLAWLCARPWRFGNDERPVGGFGAVSELVEGFAVEVEPERLRWWDVLSEAKWGAYCARQAALRREGAHDSLERTVLGRRVAEAEWDMLELIDT